MIELFLLGTGAMKPTPARFPSCYAIRYRGRLYLLDAGEGCQLRMAQAGISPYRVDAILLTHYHGDHVLGIPGLLYSMAKASRERPLKIYGPRGIEDFGEALLKLSKGNISFEVEFLEVKPKAIVENYFSVFKTKHTKNSVGYLFKEPDSVVINKRKMKEYGIKPNRKLRALKEGKVVEINGVVLKPEEWLITRRGMSVAYTGDTEKSIEVIKAVKGVDVLLHDATFLEEDKEDGHSSARDAAEVAKAAGAGVLFLTHISPRYTKNEIKLVEEALKVFPRSYLAFDLTKVVAKKGCIGWGKIIRR